MKKLTVDTKLLENNISTLLAEASKTNTKIIAMLKGNGYGLDICRFAALLVKNGIDTISVALLSEAMQIKNAGINADIILLSPTCDINEAAAGIENDIIMSVGSEESAAVLNLAAEKIGKKAKAHLAIDTGFGRFGFMAEDTGSAISALSECPEIEICGVFSHLSDSFGKEENTKKQFDRFMSAVRALEAGGMQFAMRHILNSCGFLRFPEMRLDAVRIGSAFLGRLPIVSPVFLNKIAYLKSCVCETKLLPKGSNIGYANTFKTKRDTKIAVIPIGYMDGFGVIKANDAFRTSDKIRYVYHAVKAFFKDNRTYVKIDGKQCPVLGRISMFNIIADITGTDAAAGSEVILDCNPILINPEIEREYI